MSAAPAGVLVRGSGVAAATAAQVLAGGGAVPFRCGVEPLSRAPVVMLGEQAIHLLDSVFRSGNLFTAAQRIERRIVAWGGEPAVVPHRALCISGADLAAALPVADTPLMQGAPAVTLHASAPYPVAGTRHFGRREAAAAPVELAAQADGAAAWVEATESGWLFLIPRGAGQGWLLAVGGEPDSLLGGSRLISGQIRDVSAVEARFETAPRMLEELAGQDWLAMGSGAIAFDPICGDGTAQAARGAILACAVVQALQDGDNRDDLLGHYRAMLVAAMRRHLQVSLPFYRSGGTSPWWREQADAAAEGHAWCTAYLAREPEPRFVLDGNTLVRRSMAA